MKNKSFGTKKFSNKTMEIVEAINLKDNVKEFVEDKLKRAVKEVTPYKKQLSQNSKITRFLKITQFCIDLKEFIEKIKITVNIKGYDMELGSKNLSITIGFIGKTTNALSLKCMMEFDDRV